MGFITTDLDAYSSRASKLFYDYVLLNDNFKNYNMLHNVNGKMQINSLTSEVNFQETSCDPITNSGGTTFNKTELVTGAYTLEQSYCFKMLPDYELDTEGLEKVLKDSILAQAQSKLLTDFWVGDKATGSLIDGLLTQIDVSTDVVELQLSASTLDTIVSDINKTILAMPEAMRTKNGKLTLHTTNYYYTMYRQALGFQALQNITFNVGELKMNEMWIVGEEGKIKITGEVGFVANADRRFVLLSDDNIYIGDDEAGSANRPLTVWEDVKNKLIWYLKDFRFGATIDKMQYVVVVKDF